jgi:(p)ppGpp synthase/HD superfamily hydrolase
VEVAAMTCPLPANHPAIPARTFAAKEHAARNQMHGDRPYYVHLDEVAAVLLRFGTENVEMLQAAYLHDVVEDCGVTLDALRIAFGMRVAQLVWAVTNAPGANRKSRLLATYPKVLATPGATLLKLADRIANVEQSVSQGPLGEDKLKMYRKEHPEFETALRVVSEHGEMWWHLAELLETKR